ncbi:MAG: glycine--tRNA ligase [Patescibacteria group bacterium]|jgi:glycyl-tRNA synthetase
MSKKQNNNDLMEKIVSLCKRRGFIFPGSEIYGGMANSFDFGPLGVELKNNIKNAWWKRFVQDRSDMFGLDAALIMNTKTWEASGHLDNFTDPLVECEKCKMRFREDLIDGKKCPECGGKLSSPKQFNLMFKTFVGPSEESANVAYFRPETAQGIFVNFKNIIDTMRPKLPFGIGQIGKAFRNEITPGNFIFRTREFEQMEIEYFIEEKNWEKSFAMWRKEMISWMEDLGIDVKREIHELDVPKDERAHYSKKTIDFEYKFPFGQKELYGLAYRTDYDLKQHSKHSGEELVYIDADSKKFTPHVIEPSLGVERTVLAVLCSVYNEEKADGGERVVLKFPHWLSPVKIAVFPLLKNKPQLVEKAKEIFVDLNKKHTCMFDDNGNVGKRYRRQDEIGTPYCVTVDFESLEDGAVTVRDRDSMKQERMAIKKLSEYFKDKF